MPLSGSININYNIKFTVLKILYSVILTNFSVIKVSHKTNNLVIYFIKVEKKLNRKIKKNILMS